MMHRITNQTVATAIALQQAAERRAQTTAAQTTQPAGAQYNFAEIFGGGLTSEPAAKPSIASATHTEKSFDSAIATATANVVKEDTGERQPATIPSNTAATTTTTTSASTTTTTSSATTAASAATTTAAATAATDTQPAATPAATTTGNTTTTPGVEALVTAIMNGSFQATYVTNPSQLQETTPVGTDTMPNFYYASDQTANQLAQLLGGTVVQRPAFGQVNGWTEPLANFIQLPNGQTFNAADVAYFSNCGDEGAGQLTADITATINEGAAWTNYYKSGGPMPFFPEGYVGPPISGSTYPADMIGTDGNVINPSA